MDIMTGLASASQALNLVKQLKELDIAIGQAEYKSQLLDLQEVIYETKSALLDAKQEILTRDEEISELRKKIKVITNGEACPVCNVGTLKVTKITPHPQFGELDIQQRHLECDQQSCAHKEQRMHDPNGLIDKK
ncbi:hypothetical protein GCM10008927_28130 [Amylibacter ulvae]|uniref:Uncharacterized protein n=1 Tax=Paramylibacter ulvae TaxID=1651968 RepID=A0ABQ3D687_9RHOB|nr:hypothetical protein [Amylibacter ulvae]GHA61070.1 hypothetical protein GCM10008927_28130 [Amylibacter ulvae]